MKRSYLLGGVFLPIYNRERLSDGSFLLSAGFAWLVAAAILLLIATLSANAIGLGERAMGYLSSGISFLAAVFAGMSAAHRGLSKSLPTALLTATTLVIALLTVGFLIEGESINPSAVLSIVSFTYAGVLFGVFMQPRGKKGGKRHRPSKLT